MPIGSTATIACELDNSNIINNNYPYHQLYWQRNNVNIITAEVGNQSSIASRFEHVQNENKHYLIIHNAQPFDSGVYSVCVNGVRFKVAQITIGHHNDLLHKDSQNISQDSAQFYRRLSSSRIKRISNSSLSKEK